jgi:HTH-type transcriptional regulator / antitoxin HipB
LAILLNHRDLAMNMNYPVVTIGQLPDYLRALRKARGLTQESLGILLGLKQVRIAEIEANPGSVSVGQMHRLLSALGAQMVLHENSMGWANAAGEKDTTTTSSQSTKPRVAGKRAKPPAGPATLKPAKTAPTVAAATPSRASKSTTVRTKKAKTPQSPIGSTTTPKRRGIW